MKWPELDVAIKMAQIKLHEKIHASAKYALVEVYERGSLALREIISTLEKADEEMLYRDLNYKLAAIDSLYRNE